MRESAYREIINYLNNRLTSGFDLRFGYRDSRQILIWIQKPKSPCGELHHLKIDGYVHSKANEKTILSNLVRLLGEEVVNKILQEKK